MLPCIPPKFPASTREVAAARADAAAAAGEEEFQTSGGRGGGGDGDDLRGDGEGLLRESMVCPVFAALPQEQQLEAFEPAPKGTRKFVLVRGCWVFVCRAYVWLTLPCYRPGYAPCPCQLSSLREAIEHPVRCIS